MALRHVDYTPEPYKPLTADVYPATLGAWEEIAAIDDEHDDAVSVTYVVETPEGGTRRVKRRYWLGAKAVYFLDKDLEAMGVKLSDFSVMEDGPDGKPRRFVDVEGALREAVGARCMVEVAPRAWQGTNSATGAAEERFSDDIKKVLPAGSVAGMKWK